jgi:3-oxoacyl-[acyl-carrier protein] reductase
VTLAPKVAIVTGAASGIGRHWAGVLASRGDEYRLALADVDVANLCSAFSSSERVRLHALDVRSVDHWQALVDDTVERFGRIDYLFNIAGGGRPGFLLDVPMDLIDTTIDVNLKGPIYGMRTVAPVMVRQAAGQIVNVASLAGVSPTPGHEIYSAAKFGLRAISLSTAVRLRPLGVFVTVVCPDLVDTPALVRQLHLKPEDVALIRWRSRSRHGAAGWRRSTTCTPP